MTLLTDAEAQLLMVKANHLFIEANTTDCYAFFNKIKYKKNNNNNKGEK